MVFPEGYYSMANATEFSSTYGLAVKWVYTSWNPQRNDNAYNNNEMSGLFSL